MKQKVVLGLVVVASALGVSACKSTPSSGGVGAGTASAVSPVPAVSEVQSASPPQSAPVATGWPIPQGPLLAILAGEGVGPIRFGATVKTIERLMEAPCESQTESECRYIARGAEFFLKDGALVEVRVHRLGRPTTPKPATFGVFNGRTPDGLRPMMLQDATRRMLGPPLKTETVKDGGDAHTVAIDTYDGIRVEFDAIENGSTVAGGLVILPSAKRAAAAAVVPAKKH